jgi:hypothetical protein
VIVSRPPPAKDFPVNVGGLVVDERHLTLGELAETTAHLVKFPIRNTTTSQKVIREFRGSCGCASIEPKTLTLGPGAAGEVSVVIDLTKRSPAHAGLARRPFALRLDPVFEGDFAPSTGWTLSAEVVSQLNVDMVDVAFNEGCVHEGEPATRKVRVATHAPLKRLTAEVVPPAAGTATLIPADAGRSTLAISPSPSLPPGPFRFEVVVRPVGPGGVLHAPITIDVSGEMHPTVRAFPRVVLFGEIEVPGTAEAEVVLRHPTGDGWRVGRVECDATGIEVTRVGPGPDGGTRYRITQAVTSGGDKTAAVTFVVRGPADRTENVRVELRHHGREKPAQAPIPAKGAR